MRCEALSSSIQCRLLGVTVGTLLLVLAADACSHHKPAGQLHSRTMTTAGAPETASTTLAGTASAGQPSWMQYEDYSRVDLRTARLLLSAGNTNLTAASAATAGIVAADSEQQQKQPVLVRPGPRCGVRSLTALEHSSVTFKLQKARLSAARLARPASRPGTMSIASVQQQQDRSLTVSVYFHVISGTTAEATVDAPPDLLSQQLSVMNSAYGPWNINFVLKGVTRVQSDSWAATEINTEAETAMKTRLRRGDGSALNIYLIRPSSGTLGWSTFPWELTKLGQTFDGVVIHVGTLPGGTMAPYNKGLTVVHEVGHWLGLLHVFENGCTAPGDSVDDTPAQASAAYGCPLARDTCPGFGKDPVTNYMGYTDDSCMTGFTQGQADRILDLWGVYRGKLDGAATLESGMPAAVVEQPLQQQPLQQYQTIQPTPPPSPPVQQLQPQAPKPSPPTRGVFGLGHLLPALFRRNTGKSTSHAPTSPSSVGVADVHEDDGNLYGSAMPQDPAAVFAQQQAAVAAATGQQSGMTTPPQYTQQQQQQQQYAGGYPSSLAPQQQQQQQQQQQNLIQGHYMPSLSGSAAPTLDAYAPSFTTTYRPYVADKASLPAVYSSNNPAAEAAAQQAVQAAAWQASKQQQQPVGNTLQLNNYISHSGGYNANSPPPASSGPVYIQAKPASSSSSSSGSNEWQATLLAAMGSQ